MIYLPRYDLVIDASIIGDVCRNEPVALSLFRKIQNHRIIWCTEIMKEYRPLPSRSFCKKNSRLVQEWIILLHTQKDRAKKVPLRYECYQ